MLAPWKKSYDKCRQHIKKQRYHFANKCLYSQSYGFSGSLVWMWELDHKAGWVLKNWCFWTVVLEKTLESLGQQGDQSWIIIGRTDAEALILWPPDVRSWLIGKDPDSGKDWEQEEKGMSWLNGIIDSMDMNLSKLGDSEWQGSPVCCSPWVAKSRTWLNDWPTEVSWEYHRCSQSRRAVYILHVKRENSCLFGFWLYPSSQLSREL